ncbi:hypothetical protein ABZX75_32255, partial [Streptomyces sp. NPDC003038]
MSAERAQGRGWVRIPASRAEQPPAARTAGYDQGRPYGAPYQAPYAGAAPYGAAHATGSTTDHATIYLSLVKRWREAGRTLPG